MKSQEFLLVCVCVCACVHRSFDCLASSDACSAVVVRNMQFSADITNNACLIVSAVDVKLRSKEQIYYMRCSRRRRRRSHGMCVWVGSTDIMLPL